MARYSTLNKSKNKSNNQNYLDFKSHPFDSGVSHHSSDTITSESVANIPEVNSIPHKQLEDAHIDRTTSVGLGTEFKYV